MNTGSLQPPSKIRGFFASIATRYDYTNHFLSGGCDFLWRIKAAQVVAKHQPQRILDLATGTGDLAVLLRRRCPQSVVIGADFCFPMLEIARAKLNSPLIGADALHLPFAEGSFDAVTIAFGLRNMASWPGVLAEVLRVLRTGGMFLVLDFAQPRGPFGIVYRTYLHRVLPRIAKLVTGDRDAYEYLGDSIERFPHGAAMKNIFMDAKFTAVSEKRLTGGVVAVYTGLKGD